MSLQSKLYASTERKLALWCIAAMLVMSTSFIVPAYLVVTSWLDRSYVHTDLEQPHRELIVVLVAVQGIIVICGAILSLVFARRTLRPIRQAHQAQADFAANAHHQLRTPIAVMQAEIDTALLRKKQHAAEYRQVLHSLYEEVRLLRRTSEQLLVQADGALNSTAHNTSVDIADAISLLRSRYGLRLSLATAPGLFSTISPEELVILFEILLDNTQKHAGLPAHDIRARIALEKTKNTLRLTYRDNGQGIAQGEEKQVFKRHFRGTKATAQGSGLGLAILEDIVKMHKGTVKANNLPEGGLQYTITVPAAHKR